MSNVPDSVPLDPGAATRLNNIGDWPARWAHRRPRALAVADAERRLDWAAFEARIAHAAGWLSGHGIGEGDRVGILLRNRSAYLELVFAAARIGAIALPINLRLSAREIAYIFDDCQPSALFHEAEVGDTVAAALAAAATPPPLRVAVGADPDRYELEIQDASAYGPAIPVLADAPVILMYTSGTTGAPKGALLPQRKVLYNALNAQLSFGTRAADRVLVVAPLFHSLGLQILSLPLLYAGGGLVLQPHFDAALVWAAVEREGISYFGGVPAMHQRLHDELARSGATGPDLTALRFVFTAGSAVSVELIRAYEARGIVLKQGYGQTETSTLCCLEAHEAVSHAGSVGLPVFHAELRVIQLSTRERPPAEWKDVDVGETGEIVVRGPITMLGYWERPAETAETLIDGWVCTSDLATLDADGYVTLVGRARDMIISGGENVYPAEVEAVYREHPSIREIAVVAEPDARWGEVGRAHVLLEAGHALDLGALDAWARERLATFKIPRRFVIEDDLPRTASGKIQKHKLAAPD